MKWPWSRVIEPPRTAEQLLVETLNDQITYLRHQLHISRQHESEVRRQNVLLVDARAAWNAAALEERVVDRRIPPSERTAAAAVNGTSDSHEVEYGHFQNSLGTSGHIEYEDNGERTHKVAVDIADLTDEQVEKAMLAREEAVVIGAGHVAFESQRG